jgi:hypothetical protein
MKLHSTAFERELRRGVDKALCQDVRLRREARTQYRLRAGTKRRMVGVRAGIWIFILSGVAVAEGRSDQIEIGLLAINMLLAASVLLLVPRWLALPYRSRDITALRLLPIDDDTIFRWRRDSLLKEIWFSFGDFAVAFGILGLFFDLNAWQWLALIPLAGLCALYAISLSAFAAARLPVLPYAGMSGALLLFGAGIMGAHALQFHVVPLVGRIAPVANAIMPTGWAVSLFHLVVMDRSCTVAAAILPIAFVIFMLRDSLDVIRLRFGFQEAILLSAPDLVPSPERDASVPQALVIKEELRAANRIVRVGVTEIEERILSGELLDRPQWNTGWIERLLWNWFNERQKTIADVLHPHGMALTRAWRIIFRNLIAGLVVASACLLVDHRLALVIYGAIVFFTFFKAIAITNDRGSLTRCIFFGNATVPVCAAYPVTFGEMWRVLVKITLLQAPLVWAFVVLAAIPPVAVVGDSVLHGIDLALMSLPLLISLRLFLIGSAYSVHATDTRFLQSRIFIVLSASIVFGIGAGLFAVMAILTVIVGGPGFPMADVIAWIFVALSTVLIIIYFAFTVWFQRLLPMDHISIRI